MITKMRFSKINDFHVFLQAVSFLALTVFILWTSARIQTLLMNPYGLDQSYLQINVSQVYPMSDSDFTGVMDGISKIAGDYSLTLVYDNVDAIGLGVYDTNAYYPQNDIINGRYYSSDEFSDKETSILVRDGSFDVDRIGDSIHFSQTNSNRSVIGIYNDEFVLFSSRHHYIYNFLTGDQVQGTYYVKSTDHTAWIKLIALFSKYRFDVQVIYNGYAQDSKRSFLLFASDIQMLLMASGILFIWISFVFYYLIYLFNAESLLLVSMRLGARRNRLFMNCMKPMALSSLLGCLAGITLHYMIFIPIRYMLLQGSGILAAVLIQLALTLLLFRFSFGLAIRRLSRQGYYYV